MSGVREIVVNTFVSLDGVMQAPGGPQEDPRDGFEYGGKRFTSLTACAKAVTKYASINGRAFFEFTIAHVPVLASGISPHDLKIPARRQTLVSNTRRDNNDIPNFDRLNGSSFAAKLNLRGTAIHREHFVCGAVIMVVRVDAVTPASAPRVRL